MVRPASARAARAQRAAEASICRSPPESAAPLWSARSARRGKKSKTSGSGERCRSVRRPGAYQLEVLVHRQLRENVLAFRYQREAVSDPLVGGEPSMLRASTGPSRYTRARPRDQPASALTRVFCRHRWRRRGRPSCRREHRFRCRTPQHCRHSAPQSPAFEHAAHSSRPR